MIDSKKTLNHLFNWVFKYDRLIIILGRISFLASIVVGIHNLSILNYYLTGYYLRLGTLIVFSLISAFFASGLWISTTRFSLNHPKLSVFLLLISTLVFPEGISYYHFVLSLIYILICILCLLKILGALKREKLVVLRNTK